MSALQETAERLARGRTVEGKMRFQIIADKIFYEFAEGHLILLGTMQEIKPLEPEQLWELVQALVKLKAQEDEGEGRES